MIGSKKAVTAFAVSSQGIRTVTLRNARQPVIADCRQIEVPAGEIFFAAEIGRLLNRAGDLPEKSCFIAGLECEQLFLYDMCLPGLTGRDLEKALYLQAEEICQTDFSEMIFDYMIMEGNAGDGKQERNVLMAMLDQQTSGQIASAFREKRMELDRLESLAAAAGHCVLSYQTELQQKDCFILDIQHQHCYLNYYRRGCLREIKIIERRRSDQIEAISEYIQQKAYEAEMIVLTGNIEDCPDLAAALYENTGIVSVPANCRPEVGEEARSLTDESGALLPEWAAAVGLAVSELKGVSHASANKFAFTGRQKKEKIIQGNDTVRSDHKFALLADYRDIRRNKKQRSGK